MHISEDNYKKTCLIILLHFGCTFPSMFFLHFDMKLDWTDSDLGKKKKN